VLAAAFYALRGLLTILFMLDYEIDSTDVITAFLLPLLNEEVYINLPDGYIPKDAATRFLRLLKILYGLKQSRYMSNKEISDYLISIGFTQLIANRCIFIGKYGWRPQSIYSTVCRRCNHWDTEPKDHTTLQLTH
jgi:hypothetical protein